MPLDKKVTVKFLAPKNFRIIKPEIRILGVDDGKFVPHTTGTTIVVGVVFRGGNSIDGAMHTYVEIDGFDSTDKIARMITSSPHSKQLRLVMLNGITFAGFNVVDIKKLNLMTGLPIIALTDDKPNLEAIQAALKNLPFAKNRWKTVLDAGEIHEVNCKGKALFLVMSGVSLVDAQKIIKLTSVTGCIPEPLRVAHLIASGITP
jgi:uncharacterized protein